MYTPILVLLGLIVFAFLYLTALSDGEFAVYVWHLLHPDLRKEKEERQRKEEQAWERRLQEKEQEEILSRLRRSVWETFAVDLSVIHQAETQNEIVRVLDLLAYQVAIACVNEDKATRGEKIEPYRDTSIYATEHSWSEMVPKLKREWAGKRSFALQICPELKDRLPHFSEFEPLKSYREEHIHQKAEEKKARKIQL